MVRLLNTEQDCRLVYASIVRGYSYSPDGNFILKHYNELDLCETEFYYRKYLKEAEEQGLLSEKDKLDLLNEHGHWTIEEENEYQQEKRELDGFRFSLPKLFIPQQIEHLTNKIKEKEKLIQAKFGSRFDLLGTTKENYANRKSHENHVLSTFCKDESLTIPQFSKDERDYLSELEVINFLNIYNQTHEIFTEKNLKRIAVCPFFLNAFLASDNNPYYFYGKSISCLSIYQLALFNKGGYYKFIIEEPETVRPPEEFYEDLTKVVQHYDKQYSLLMGRRKSNK